MSLLNNVETAIGQVGKLVNRAAQIATHVTPLSVADASKLTRVEPLVIVSPDCMNLEYMPQVSQSILSLFCAYYLQGIEVLCSIQNVEVIKILDRLNPNRDMTGFLLIHNESTQADRYKYSLPMPGVKLHMEASVTSELNEAINLSVGRLLDVSISVPTGATDIATGKKTMESHKVKVQVRLLTNSVPENVLNQILTNGTEERTFIERYHAWKAGRLEFIRDLVLCQDLINAKMKLALSDTTGVAADILSRVQTNRRMGLLTANPSLATASNIFVISEEIATRIEAKLGGKLTDYNTRKKLFETSYAMLLVVINRETGRIRIFVNGQTDYATVSRKEIESQGKKGPDVMELFRALQSGSFSNF